MYGIRSNNARARKPTRSMRQHVTPRGKEEEEEACSIAATADVLPTGSMRQNVTPRGKEEEEAACGIACDSGRVCPAEQTGNVTRRRQGGVSSKVLELLFQKYPVSLPFFPS